MNLWARQRSRSKVKKIAGQLQLAAVTVVALAIGASVLGLCAVPEKPLACSAPEFRQFDFWVGDWDAFDAGATTAVARVRVDRFLDGCVLREDYRDTSGLHGQSFSLYDVSRKVWHQSWVTNQGQLLVIDGNLHAGEMILSGMDPARGEGGLVRGTWTPIAGGVREVGITSRDGGKTWRPWFDLIFRPHREGSGEHDPEIETNMNMKMKMKVQPSAGNHGAPGSAAIDRRTVADLDTAYQAAVKNHDAAAMDRILADDFVLVTGAGKIYTKADLLDEARNNRRLYEHQDELTQTVRVWGDTAVVTAKLWMKGTENGNPFDYRLWFSDTYIRTPTGWRYVFGQSSKPLE
jgi:ketosteroid isomerase-like protein